MASEVRLQMCGSGGLRNNETDGETCRYCSNEPRGAGLVTRSRIRSSFAFLHRRITVPERRTRILPSCCETHPLPSSALAPHIYLTLAARQPSHDKLAMQ
jgi:hypothetical protein